MHRADDGRCYLVYSLTKTYLAVVLLRLGVAVEARVQGWFDDPRLPDATIRQLLQHTSGIPDYMRLPEYNEAIGRDETAWSDDELLDRALALGPDFEPGTGWRYSNTAYLLLRLIVEREAGFEEALSREVFEPLGLRQTRLALRPIRRGERIYDPLWVGHRTIESTADEVRRFYVALARGELVPVETLLDSVPIGKEAPGYVRPSYGLGVMHDPAWPHGPLLGHGGAGPGFRAAAFAVLREEPVVAVVLSDDEALSSEERAQHLLGSVIRDAR